MRIVFMGTPDFAVPCLNALVDAKHEVCAVFSQPDKPVGRKQILTPPPVKQTATQYGIPVYQPAKIKGSDSAQIIKDINPDIIVVVAYGKILPKEILTAAKYGCVNVHASLLPKYRGAAPIQWAVLNGDKETGVTIMQMDEGLDTGDMLSVVKTEIGENETSAELFDRLSEIGAKALIKTLLSIENGTAVRTPQPEGDFGYARMLTKADCEIDFNKSAAEIHNKVRGLQTWPVAITTIGGKRVKIHKTVLTKGHFNKPAGEIISAHKELVVCCGDGRCIEIKELQPEGKKRMYSVSFLLGNPVKTGTIIGG